MKAGFRLTPVAQTHLVEITDFIAEESADAAFRVLDAFEEAFQRLAAMPDIGHKREDLTDRPVKFWSVYSYLIVYDPASAPLIILAIIHGARDVETVLRNV